MPTVDELRRVLLPFPDDTEFEYGFCRPHSWRGIYAEPAVAPSGKVKVGDMRGTLARLLTEEFGGWKGGEYRYGPGDEVHLSHEGDSYEHSWSRFYLSLAAALAPAGAEAILNTAKEI